MILLTNSSYNNIKSYKTWPQYISSYLKCSLIDLSNENNDNIKMIKDSIKTIIVNKDVFVIMGFTSFCKNLKAIDYYTYNKDIWIDNELQQIDLFVNFLNNRKLKYFIFNDAPYEKFHLNKNYLSNNTLKQYINNSEMNEENHMRWAKYMIKQFKVHNI